MTTDDERCAEAKRLARIDEAFRAGDLEALRRALDDPTVVPNGAMPDAVGSCLVYAISHSPLTFIRTLLELGANPNAPVDDGFPPLIAALSCARDIPGATKRADVDEVIRLLLSYGADPNQRGINDYTPLHMAVAVRATLGVQYLLDGGADADLRTRIDECETAGEMAAAAGLTDIAELLARKGQPLRQRLRPGLVLLLDVKGEGDPVRRQHTYRLRSRLWLENGEPVRWKESSDMAEAAGVNDGGVTQIWDARISRSSLINGLFYGLEGMRVGGTRRLRIAPHLAWGESGVPGVIPAGASLTAEITVMEFRW
jgi:uncharacterized protein